MIRKQKMLYLPSFLRKGVSLGRVGRNQNLKDLKGCYVTKFAPHKAPELIARGKLAFDERVALHRVGVFMCTCVKVPFVVWGCQSGCTKWWLYDPLGPLGFISPIMAQRHALP